MKLAPLFLVSLTAVGMETALTRYFAVASWSDYGYWVISIVMVGFAFSGVLLALAEAFLQRHAAWLLAALPALLLLSAGLGYSATILNPFNPLQLQNPDTYAPQLVNIALYYAALLPFFFLAGLFISLFFVTNVSRIGQVYAADLLGAGAGSMLVLALMYWLPPFALVPALLPALAVAAWFSPAYRIKAGAAALTALAAAELLFAFGPQAAVSQYKPVYAPSHTPGAKTLAKIERPGGEFMLLDDFTERVNTDISNDATMLGYADPPRSYGLYRDGSRIASLPGPAGLASGYAPGALDAGPYQLEVKPDVLLIGASGGFGIAEALRLGAAHVTALAPEPVLYAALRHGIGPSPAFPGDPRVTISPANPRQAVLQGHRYHVISIAADFMDAAPANVTAFSAEAFAADLASLQPGGVLSIPVSIEDFPAYALRMLSTVRAGLALSGVNNPADYVIIYRSAWNARSLVSNTPFTLAQVNIISTWCNDRSFDVSYYNGMNIIAARDNLYNDLPAVSFDAGTITSTGDDDSLADEAAGILAGQQTNSANAFDLRPVTDDRPAFYAILRLNQLSLLLARLQILPQPEIGALVNLAVLAQAVVLALLVLVVPVFAPKRPRESSGVFRPALYFSLLAVAFLFLEIFAIEKASFFLDDRAAGFSIVLSAMLIFSGLGSFLSARLTRLALAAVWLAAGVICLWGAAMLWLLTPAMLAGGGLGYGLRAVLVVAAMAPVSLAMGLPFPLGLARIDQKFFLPWAWGLNGAFSVVATPLANLLLRNIGSHGVLGGAVLLYVVAATSFPAHGRERFWIPSLKKSAVVDS
jgi:hypothetical protein